MKLLPFNLERALAGDKVVTRDGREVGKIVHFPELKSKFNVFYFIRNHTIIDGEYNFLSGDFVTESGDYRIDCKTGRDLLMVFPETIKKTYWANVYRDSIHKNDLRFGSVFSGEGEAKNASNINYVDVDFVKTISFEIEE